MQWKVAAGEAATASGAGEAECAADRMGGLICKCLKVFLSKYFGS
jgi:hypothetical protein